MKRTLMRVSSILFLCVVFAFPAQVLAAPYYEGKVITVICGLAAGGGYDYWARLLAKHLPKHIPGNPTVIVQNMTGAASMIATHHLYDQVKPDGLTLLTFERGILFNQMMKDAAVRYDFSKFAWVGSVASEAVALYCRADLPYKTFDDLLKAKEPIPWGDQGSGSYHRIIPLILRDHAGLRVKMVSYPGGTAEFRLAAEGKEIDCLCGAYETHINDIARGLLRPLLRGRIAQPGIETLPVWDDLVKDQKAKSILAMYAALDKIAKPYVAPPKTPEDVTNILREALKKVSEDPQFVGEAKKVKRTVNYVSGQDALETANFVLNQPEDVVKEFMRYGKL
jgi:tripartite-type tricarboxylate transporter receptor subunit TctC